MDQNDSDSSSKKFYTDDIWQEALGRGYCPYGCKITRTACKHLEAQLPKISGQSVNARPVAFIEELADLATYGEGHEDKLDEFIESIADFALTTDQVRILVGRCLYSLTFAEISRTYSISSPALAHKLYKKALDTLKKGGYGEKR